MHKTLTMNLLSTLFCLTAFSLLSADEAVSTTQNDNSFPQVSTSSEREQKQYLPSARPEVQDGIDLFISADLLILKATETGLSYAVADYLSDSTSIRKGHVRNLNFDYNYGFELGLGCNLSHDGWDAILNWTWFRDDQKKKTDNDDGRHTLFTTLISPKAISASVNNDLAFATSAHADWHLKLDLLDLEMGRDFSASKWLSLRPFFGLRSAWIRQHYTVDYKNVSSLFQNGPSFDLYKVHMINNYWGFGPRIGLNSQWGFGSGFSFYGNAAIAVLYGYFDVSDLEKSNSSALDNEDIQKEVKNSFHATKAATDLEIGIQWDWMFLNDAFHLGLHAGWQQQIFFSQNQFMRFTNPIEQGQFLQNQSDLGFQGFSIGARIDF